LLLYVCLASQKTNWNLRLHDDAFTPDEIEEISFSFNWVCTGLV